MENEFGPELFPNNETLPSAMQGSVAHIYSAEEIAIILGALGAMVASIIYSVKNVKHSSCCVGLIECDQITELRSSRRSENKSPTSTASLTLDSAHTATIV